MSAWGTPAAASASRTTHWTLSAAVLIAATIGGAVAMDAWLLVAFVATVVVAAIVLAVPRQFVVITIAVSASEMLVPEPSRQLQVFMLAAIAVVAWRVVDCFWSGTTEEWTIVRLLVAAFTILVVATMAYRGVGFQSLGGSQAGGVLYVRLLVTAAFALLLPGIHLSDRQWRRALIGMCLMSSLPLAADLTAVYLRPLARLAWSFFELSPSVAGLALGMPAGEGPFRWFSATALSAYLTILVFLLERPVVGRGGISSATVAGLVFAFAIASFSGHRLAILNVVGIAGLVLLLDKRLTLRRMLAGVVGLIICLIVLRMIAPSLPEAVQRAISWIPGVNVSADAGRSASDSVAWRIAVWVLALQEVPKYLWIGRGLAYSNVDLTAARSASLMSGEVNWAIVQGYFHNGWLSLLILLGVAGLLLGFALLAVAALRHLRLTRAVWQRTELQRYHRVITAWLVLQVGSYWLIYGDVQVSFPEFFLMLAILEALRSNDGAAVSPFKLAVSERV